MAVTTERQEGAARRQEGAARAPGRGEASGEGASAFALAGAQSSEAVGFLAARPVHTAYLAGLIRDNGVISPLNRGTFYGARDARGRLEGVALVGHATLVEARSEAALAAFARLARTRVGAPQLVRIERECVEPFWRHYEGGAGVGGAGARPPLVCRETLYELKCPVEVRAPVAGLRRATLGELAEVMEVNAALAVAECGVNPAERDPVGFRVRTARRIEQGRVWVWRSAGRLVFKADVLSDTPGAVYVEGVYVHPEERGRGHGLRCLSQLGRVLLRDADSVCLTADEQSESVQNFYRKAGYRLVCRYDTLAISD